MVICPRCKRETPLAPANAPKCQHCWTMLLGALPLEPREASPRLDPHDPDWELRKPALAPS